jgi:hypothetical protein
MFGQDEMARTIRNMMTNVSPSDGQSLLLETQYYTDTGDAIAVVLRPFFYDGGTAFHAALVAIDEDGFPPLEDAPVMNITPLDIEWYVSLIESYLDYREFTGGN